MASGFRAVVFDPILIIAKILTLQCCFYTTLGLWIVIADSIGGIHKSVDQIFDFRVKSNYDNYIYIPEVWIKECDIASLGSYECCITFQDMFVTQLYIIIIIRTFSLCMS